jgi:acyl-CoA synthetase (AMP-forming)/AMP-acid ligase II
MSRFASAPSFRRIDEFVSHWAQETPEATACVLGGSRTSYAELDSRIRALARALLRAGVKKGDRVATLSTPHPDFLVCFLAASAVGAIWLGLNPRYRLEELRHVLDDSEPSLLFTRRIIEGRDYAPEVLALRETTPSLRHVVQLDEGDLIAPAQAYCDFVQDVGLAPSALETRQDEVGERDPCMIVYTSGSTGTPKGAMLHHRGLVLFAVRQNQVWPVSPLVMLNYFPINHVGCTVDVTMPILAAGGTNVFMEHFDPLESMELMERESVTLWASVPSVFQMQLELPAFSSFDLSSVQLTVFAGAAMPEPMIRRLAAIVPRIATNYGMTETTSAITELEPTDNIEHLAHTVGHAFPGVEVRLVGADGKDVSPGETGEVWTRSEQNFLGYWKRPDATSEVLLADGFFRTGDLAMQRPDGRYRIVGRIKEMYKSGGYNVYPREIEIVIESHPAVAVAAVVSVPDPVWQEVGVAYVVAKAALSPDDLLTFCRERLANYKLPKHIYVRDELPLLPIGKVDKPSLRKLAISALQAPDA